MINMPSVLTMETFEVLHVRDEGIGVAIEFKKEHERPIIVLGILKSQVHALHQALSEVIESDFENSG